MALDQYLPAFFSLCASNEYNWLCTTYFENNSSGNLEDEKFTTVKVAADWPSDSASDWASHSTVFNHSKVDYLNPLFLATFKDMSCHVNKWFIYITDLTWSRPCQVRSAHPFCSQSRSQSMPVHEIEPLSCIITRGPAPILNEVWKKFKIGLETNLEYS
jgi:hypothetical protein